MAVTVRKECSPDLRRLVEEGVQGDLFIPGHVVDVHAFSRQPALVCWLHECVSPLKCGAKRRCEAVPDRA